jgi:hypothetical protein|tara:strand:+ start:3447 stop:3716 length:270 start_codon:yes stop_codon:yes gene_type:complete
MELLKLPIKSMLAVAGVFVALTGFYYTTGFRLNLLEAQAVGIDENEEQIQALREQAVGVNSSLIRIDEKLDDVKVKLDNVETMIKERGN